jgi:hypothetical protein
LSPNNKYRVIKDCVRAIRSSQSLKFSPIPKLLPQL